MKKIIIGIIVFPIVLGVVLILTPLLIISEIEELYKKILK